MEEYTVSVIAIEEIARNTLALHLERPEGFTFEAGQFAHFEIINPPGTDEKGMHRPLSLASAPFEDTLTVAVRLRNTAFKQALAQLGEGDKLHMEGPYGNFRFVPRPDQHTVFLAGGIGITPFRSMVRSALHKGYTGEVTLFYANRERRDAAFLSELKEASHRHRHFSIVATTTEQETFKERRHEETTPLSSELLERYIADMSTPLYYIAGPPGMVADMRTLLNTIGVPPANIAFEEFAGYE